MKGLFLHGVNCTSRIWSQVREHLAGIDADYVEYPMRSLAVQTVLDITKWFLASLEQSLDFVVGHSMAALSH